MVGKKNQSALLAKYFNLYKKNPRSRVFAPLAESYRKLGMIEDAYKILKDGIRNHPNYALGYVVLAHCYYDEEKYELTYSTLRPIVSKNTDNISLQKLFAQACIHLGYNEEALDTYKYLLFMNPRDRYFAEQVKRLEDDLMVGHKRLSLDQLIKTPEMLKLSEAPETLDDDWVQVDFNRPEEKEEPSVLEDPKAKTSDAEDGQWVMKSGPFNDHPILKESRIPEIDLEDEFYADEFEDEGDIDEVNTGSLSSESPIVSHTLIDLYCNQHYYDKAIELLEKIIELNPDDQASREKLSKVRDQKLQNSGIPREISEQEGHDELISIIESQVKVRSPREQKLAGAFKEFLDLLKEKAALHQ